MQTKEWVTPTFTVLNWEQVLEAEGLGNPEKDLNYVSLRDTDGVRIPAQSVRDGGCFFRERAAINWGDEHRSKGSAKRPRLRLVCPVCARQFEGTKRAKFCSAQCGTRIRVQRLRAKRVTGNLRTLSEENGNAS